MRSARQSHVRVCKYMISPLRSRLNRSAEGWSWPPHAEMEMESDRTGVMRSGEGSDDAWKALDDNNNLMIEVMIHGWWQMPQCSLIRQITITVLYTDVHLHTENKGWCKLMSNFHLEEWQRQNISVEELATGCLKNKKNKNCIYIYIYIQFLFI